jgi:hypothetical protein
MREEHDFKIEEVFDLEVMAPRFIIHRNEPQPDIIAHRFETLREAEHCVRMLRKYRNRIFHLVED